jgi:predicted benzoate:H+ symporter BenE
MNFLLRFRMVRRYWPGAWLAVALILAGTFSSTAHEIAAQAPRDADVIIVGAGISGIGNQLATILTRPTSKMAPSNTTGSLGLAR